MTGRKADHETTLEELLQQVKDYGNMSESSRQLLREDPIGYSATRNRQLRAALLEGDEEQVETLVADVSGVVGRSNAEMWKLNVMGKIVEESLKNQE